MSGIVGPVAIVGGEVNRNTTVIGHRQNVEQLFQIRAMIFAVSLANRNRGFAATQHWFFELS